MREKININRKKLNRVKTPVKEGENWVLLKNKQTVRHFDPHCYVMKCLYSRLDCKQSLLYAEDGGLTTRRPKMSVPHKEDGLAWLAQLQRVGSKTPRAPVTRPPTLMNWWTIMCRQCFFMSKAWVLSAASRIWKRVNNEGKSERGNHPGMQH